MGREPMTAPAEIAATVRRTGEHQAIEQQFGKLQACANETREKLRVLIADNYSDLTRAKKEIQELSAAQDRLRKQMRPLATKLGKLRAERARRVAEAIAPARAAAAGHAIEAAKELRCGLVAVDECTRQFFEAGGGDGFWWPALTGLLDAMLAATVAELERSAGR